jgi:hypothetical protein
VESVERYLSVFNRLWRAINVVTGYREKPAAAVNFDLPFPSAARR